MPSAAWEWGLWGPFQSQHSGILWFCDLHSPFQPNHSMNIVILDNICVCCSTDAHIRNQAANSSTIYLPSQTASSPELLSSIPTNSAVPQLAPDLQRTQGQGQAALTPGSPTAPSPITGAGRERSSACSVLCTAGSLFLLQAGSCCISAKQHKEQHMLGVLTATGQTWVLFSAPHSYWKSLNMTLLPAERFANCFGRCV